MTKMLCAALTLSLLLPAAAHTAESKLFPFDYRIEEIENGLKVVPIVRAGSRNEVEPGKSGFAHFGEHRQSLSLLFQKIREERSQNYGNFAYIEHFIQGRDKFPAVNYARQQQYFSIWIRPLANPNRHFVIRQAQRELRKLVEYGISEERFELTRTYLLNSTRLYAQTLDERIGWRIDSRHYGYKDFLDEVQNRLPRITREDVNRAIRKYLNFDNVIIAVITEDAEGFRDALIAESPSPISYANPNMPEEILQEDLVIQSYALGVRPENVRIAPASAFFRKAGLPME